ncbi:DUF998 domain-containing protein [Pseudoalteromonas fenneropenaei]|uniref:DUF998 domain-containing protein n=1 Tax=Pseudoalteromonas fenneropenaei TaxID=1737459 RepID=A0ABV7CNJ1_9GAMM
METVAVYAGLIASIWIFVGVYVAGRFYQGYSHSKQFCSELGAAGSPTEKISPFINNYPLGVWFCLFGWYVTQLQGVPMLLTASGWLVICHGIGTWFAGYFPMDLDPYTKHPTTACKIHSIAGMIILLSLIVAPILIVISPPNDLIPWSFRIFSVVNVVAACYFLSLMVKAIKAQSNPGLYQRISYGIQLSWLSVFSLLLA